MRYVPGLIPRSSRVLPDYFRCDPSRQPEKNKAATLLAWILGAFFLLLAVACLLHPILTMLYGAIGFIVLPPGQRFLEQKFRFRMTRTLKMLTAAAMFIGSIPVFSHYAAADRREAAAKKEITDKLRQQRHDSFSSYIQQSRLLVKEGKFAEASDRLERASAFASVADDTTLLEKEARAVNDNVNDSFNSCLRQASLLVRNGSFSKAEKWLQRAGTFTLTGTDTALVNKEIFSLSSARAISLAQRGRYAEALTQINELLNSQPGNKDLIYYRALSCSRTGDIRGAVGMLKPLIAESYPGAEKLHEQINPLRKRIAYYVTRCWDGSTSGATGRGACSHHGGVKNWNEPVYEEYRKYE